MEILKGSGIWDSPGAALWRQAKDMAVTDSSLRSITPHIVRSRLLLFGNVLVDQRHSLAIHNIRKECTIHNGLSRPKDCGSIHYGFCRAVEEPKAPVIDVKSQINKIESASSEHKEQPPLNKQTPKVTAPEAKSVSEHSESGETSQPVEKVKDKSPSPVGETTPHMIPHDSEVVQKASICSLYKF